MYAPLTCPACTASFTPADDLRGKKAFCPKCGTALIVTGAGIAKVSEQARGAPSRAPEARRWNPLWLLLALPLFVLPCCGVAVYLLSFPVFFAVPAVVKNDQQQPAPPRGQPKIEADPGRKTIPLPQPEPEQRREFQRPLPAEPVKKQAPKVLDPIKVEPTSAKYLTILSGHLGPVCAVAFDLSDQTLAAGSRSASKTETSTGEIKLWNLVDKKATTKYPIGSGKDCLAFSADGKVVYAGSDPFVYRWKPATNEALALFQDTGAKLFVPMAVSRDAILFAFSGGARRGKKLQLWRSNLGEIQAAFDGSEGHSVAAFTPDGALLASSDQVSVIRCWDTATGNSSLTIQLERSPTLSIRLMSFAADNKTLRGVDALGTIRRWNALTGEPDAAVVLETKYEAGTTHSFAFSPDGQALAVGSDHGLQLWNTATGKRLARLADNTCRVYSMTFSHDGTLLAAGCSDGTVKLWRIRALLAGNNASP